MNELKWTLLNSAQEVAAAASRQILQQAEIAIRQRGIYRIVLAGGSTPQMTYELLGKKQADWSNWAFYFGDERCLPAGHAELNSTMARQSLLDHVAVNTQQIHSIPAHLGAEQAADLYLDIIKPALPFDTVLLGMGEDGHTASIFPGQNWQNQPLVYPVHDAPKPPPDRVTLSKDALANTRKLLYLVTGAGKATAVKKWLQGESLPVNAIPLRADTEVLIDKQLMLSAIK